MMKGKGTIAWLLAILIGATAHAAAPPEQVNFQGKLEDAFQAPVDDALDITFTLYDASTGGTALWSETHFGVTVRDGLFNVSLGAHSGGLAALFDGSDRWLEIQVAGDEPMTPRQYLTSVPYALHAGDAVEAEHALDADRAELANHSLTADSAETANRTLTADSAGTANHALTADRSTTAERADVAANAEDVTGADIHPASVTISGYGPVIDAAGQWVGDPTGLQGPPGDSILGQLNCATDQIIRYNGSEWVCADAVANPLAALNCAEGDLLRYVGGDWQCSAPADDGTVPPIDDTPDPASTLSVGLVGHWPLNGHLLDASPNGFNGTLGGATSGRDRFGDATGALYFDGYDMAQVAHRSALNPANLTISAWVYGTTYNLGEWAWPRIVDKSSWASKYGYSLNLHRLSYNFRFEMYTTGGSVHAIEGPKLALSRWQHVAVTYDGSVMKLYYDGRLANSATINRPIRHTSGSLNFGNRHDGGAYRPFKGSIDDVRLYNRALSAEEIAALTAATP